MGTQQPLPPTPPLGPQGFEANTWQRWLEILRRRLSEAYSPDNPPPEASQVGANPALVGTILEQLDSLIRQVATLPDATAAVGQLRMDAALLGEDANFHDLTVNRDLHVVRNTLMDQQLQVNGAVGFNGTAPSGATAYPANATDLPTVITLANAIKAALVAKGI